MKLLPVLLLLSIGGLNTVSALSPPPVQNGTGRVERLMRAGQYDQALNLLLPLYRSGQHTPKIIGNINRCYNELKNYPEWIVFLNDVVLQFPTQYGYRLTLGSAYFLNGEKEKAMAVWRAIYQKPDATLMHYRRVAQTLYAHRLWDEAAEVYIAAMQKFPDESTLWMDMGNLYRVQSDYEKATTYYMRYLLARPKQGGYIRSVLLGLARDAEAADRIISVLESEKNANPAVAELLMYLYMRAGRYDDAYQQTLLLEKSTQSVNKGLYLNRFINEAGRSRQWPYVLKAYHDLLQNLSGPRADNPSYMLARAEYRYAQSIRVAQADKAAELIRDALERLRQLMDRNSHKKVAAAMLAGDIYKNFYGDPDEALRFYTLFPLQKIGKRDADRLRLKIARIHIEKNQIEEARRQYNALQSPSLKNIARWHLAELDFYSARFKQARKKYTTLLSAAGLSDTLSNNVLQRLFLLENLPGDSSALAVYAHALFLEKQNKPDKAAAVFSTLATRHGPLSREALNKALELYARLQTPQKGIEVAEQWLRQNADDPQADEIIYTLAGLYRDSKAYEKARNWYEQIMIRFPSGFYADEARKQARMLNKTETRQP